MSLIERLKPILGKRITKIIHHLRLDGGATRDHVHLEFEDGSWLEIYGVIGASKRLTEKGPSASATSTLSVSEISLTFSEDIDLIGP